MKKLSKPVVVLSTLFALGVGGMAFSGVQGIRQIPLVSELNEKSDAANKKLDSIKKQEHTNALLCVKNGGGIRMCLEAETRTIDEAAKPVQESNKKAHDARVMNALYSELFMGAGILSVLTGAILLARRAFQKRREQQEQNAPKQTGNAEVLPTEIVDTIHKGN